MKKTLKISETILVKSLARRERRRREVPARGNDRVNGDSTEVDNHNFKKRK
jgi:hypothetical protein